MNLRKFASAALALTTAAVFNFSNDALAGDAKTGNRASVTSTTGIAAGNYASGNASKVTQSLSSCLNKEIGVHQKGMINAADIIEGTGAELGNTFFGKTRNLHQDLNIKADTGIYNTQENRPAWGKRPYFHGYNR